MIIGSYAFSEDVFLDGMLGGGTSAQITAAGGRDLKIQPAFSADAAFQVNFGGGFSAGLSAGLLYTLSSGIEGGWSYPGFSGFEAGLDLQFLPEALQGFGLGAGGAGGWYKYNLSTSMFFLPSVSLYPLFRLPAGELIDLQIELPVKLFFHREAALFMSAGIGFMVVFK